MACGSILTLIHVVQLASRSKVKGQGEGRGQRSRWHLSTGVECSIMVVGFAKYSKKSLIKRTLRNHRALTIRIRFDSTVFMSLVTNVVNTDNIIAAIFPRWRAKTVAAM